MRSSFNPRSEPARRSTAPLWLPSHPDGARSNQQQRGQAMTRGIRWFRSSILGGLLAMALAPTTGSITASTTQGVEITSTPLPVEHIIIKTMKTYPEGKAGVEKLGRIHDRVRAMLTKNHTEGLRATLKPIAGEDGLAIHYIAFHGDLLVLKGERRPLTAYYI